MKTLGLFLAGFALGWSRAQVHDHIRAAEKSKLLSKCAWCGKVLRMDRPDSQEQMRNHIERCPEHALYKAFRHPAVCVKAVIDQHIATCGATIGIPSDVASRVMARETSR